MNGLREGGLEEDTIVFFTSDNGGTGGGAGANAHRLDFFRSNGTLRGQKGQLYEGGIRVPMIVRWKGRVRPNVVNNFPWAFWDVMPTFADLAGAPRPATDGISVLPAILNQPLEVDRFLYWETPAFDRSANRLRAGVPPQAVRWRDWKALRLKPGAPVELYDLRKDPSETVDVASTNLQVVRRIEHFLKTARTEPRPHDSGGFEFAR
jgi:arylsulfatase A-like enzyme